MQRFKDNKKTGGKERKRMGLGRGLASLIPDAPAPPEEDPGEFFSCEIGLISPNPYQPRERFSPEELSELSASIRENGIIQPLLVRKGERGYQLIAGERRLRSAKMAGLSHVPVIIKEISDRELLELSIIENIQRENLNPMEESKAYQRLMDEFGFTQEKVAKQVGKSRSAVANFLRLGQLPAEIQDTIVNGSISMGHARALLGTDTPEQQAQAWKTVMARGLSVRETEKLVKELKSEKPGEKKPPLPPPPNPYATLSEGLARHFNTPVAIRKKGKKGRLEISFTTDEELQRLVKMLGIVEELPDGES